MVVPAVFLVRVVAVTVVPLAHALPHLDPIRPRVPSRVQLEPNLHDIPTLLLHILAGLGNRTVCLAARA